MKSFWEKWLASIFTLSLLASCGGGGGGTSTPSGGGVTTGDTMTVTIDSGTPTTYDELTGSNPWGFDPYLAGFIVNSGTGTNIALYKRLLCPYRQLD